jgi:D-lactate dehydrogenase
MDVAFFSAKEFEKKIFDRLGPEFGRTIHYYQTHLNSKTAVLASGAPVVCAFVSDCLDAATVEALKAGGCRLIALRSAGFNHVDLGATARAGIAVVRVPAYSPHAIAEHAVAMMLALDRKIYKAYNRVREGNFSLEGLMGFDLASRSVGVVGTGLIGSVVSKILLGFGCRVLASDPLQSQDLKARGVVYMPVDEMLSSVDVLTLHCPLTPETRHLISAQRLARMRKGTMLINTGRGALIDTKAVIGALKSGQLGYLGLDVYEEEENLFFEDLSDQILTDDTFARLLTFPNVLITGHQAFLTQEALEAIALATLRNIDEFAKGLKLSNQVQSAGP